MLFRSLPEGFASVAIGGGLLPGEKLHEQLIADEEVARTYDYGSHYRIIPANYANGTDAMPQVPADFTYVSSTLT